QVLDKVVLQAYVEASDSRSILDLVRGQRTTLPNAPQDSKQEARLRDAVSRLRRRDRELLQLAYWDELGESELGEVLGTDSDTVAARRERALANYRALVRRLSPDTDPGEPSRLFRSIKPGVRTRWQ
ncbi:MAG: sigma factor-like helix-turn-helix DNA-binding protein, partial [Propionicimonas sp.]|nr:sigma factor-like helix-turn-helix DNA-binding protein [Propionicimonas sp.]